MGKELLAYQFGVAQNRLLELWLDTSASQGKLPPINLPKAKEALEAARVNREPVELLAIGCHDWAMPEDGFPNRDWTIRRIFSDNKRLQRFSHELSSFQTSLRSFGVATNFHFTMSDVEATMLIHFDDMDAVLHNKEDAQGNMIESFKTAQKVLTKSEVEIKPFDHLCIAQDLTQTHELSLTRNTIAGSANPSLRELSDGLYRFDLTHVRSHFTKDKPHLLLNIQSIEFDEEIESLKKSVENVSPNTPIIFPARNAGNWHAAPEPEIEFLDAQGVISGLLGINEKDADHLEWKRIVHGKSDGVLRETSDILEVTLDVKNERELLVSFLSALAFGGNIEDVHEHETTPVLHIDGPILLLDAIATISGHKKSHIRSLMKDGRVLVDGRHPEASQMIIDHPATVEVGKRIRFRIEPVQPLDISTPNVTSRKGGEHYE